MASEFKAVKTDGEEEVLLIKTNGATAAQIEEMHTMLWDYCEDKGIPHIGPRPDDR